jgi:hypothetical protein
MSRPLTGAACKAKACHCHPQRVGAGTPQTLPPSNSAPLRLALATPYLRPPGAWRTHLAHVCGGKLLYGMVWGDAQCYRPQKAVGWTVRAATFGVTRSVWGASGGGGGVSLSDVSFQFQQRTGRGGRQCVLAPGSCRAGVGARTNQGAWGAPGEVRGRARVDRAGAADQDRTTGRVREVDPNPPRGLKRREGARGSFLLGEGGDRRRGGNLLRRGRDGLWVQRRGDGKTRAATQGFGQREGCGVCRFA